MDYQSERVKEREQRKDEGETMGVVNSNDMLAVR
jgi:hypothetical protein